MERHSSKRACIWYKARIASCLSSGWIAVKDRQSVRRDRKRKTNGQMIRAVERMRTTKRTPYRLAYSHCDDNRMKRLCDFYNILN